MTMTAKLLTSDAEIERLCPVLLELRPQYDAASLMAQIRLQREEGYQLAYVSEGEVSEDEAAAEVILCVAGFVIGNKLAWGKHLYVDDLVSSEQHRSRGAGKLLLDFLKDYARKNQCSQFHLDSGVQRFAAHRFYLREGMVIASHHFSIDELSLDSHGGI